MKTKTKLFHQSVMAALAALSISGVYALHISEDFTQGRTSRNWLMPLPGDGISTGAAAQNNACLTAGTSTTVPTGTVAGSPPRCSSSGGDAVGQGALRLTPAARYKVGGIVSDFTFPTNDGVEITFTTYTWGGDGADGMAFILADADRPPTLGASGGALGYPCSLENPIFSGVDGGYLGIGIDEYGNYVNPGDNTNTGPGFLKNTIGIRGAGVVNYSYITNPDRFLQDVYTKQGWGSVPQSVKTAWINKWAQDLSTASALQLRNGTSSNIRGAAFRQICQSGKLTLTNAETNGRGTLELSDAANDPKLKLYNYKYLAHRKLNTTLYSSVGSRAEATALLYRIRITPDGKASVWFSQNGGVYQPIIEDQDIITTNGPLPRAFRFGFMGATGGRDNNHEVTCFQAAPAVGSEGSASVSLPNARVVADTQLYFSRYSPQFRTGQVLAQTIMKTPEGVYYVNPVANWEASCNLTGGRCEDTGQANVTAQANNTRVFWSSKNGQGISLEWNNLSPEQQSRLQGPGETNQIAAKRLAYLKGDRSEEQTAYGVGLFRKRQGLLGDVINSSPTWVGYPSQRKYERNWVDLRYPTAQMPEQQANAQTYAAYSAERLTRTNVVYAGANDGFLHAFRSGAYAGVGEFDTTHNDGRELLAYMPAAVLSRMHRADNRGLDFSHVHYAHNFYNDAAPATGDVFYGGQWHTWLLSGLGTGGNTVYALDITNPDDFTAANAATKVIGEWSYQAGDAVWQHLGNSYGTPVFGRFHDGKWGAVFGNGWCSAQDADNGNCTASAGPAGIYVMSIDQNSGQPTFRFISTGEGGTVADPNGIAYVTPVDIDTDMIYDYAYAGDLKGNVWRFDLTANDADVWTQRQPQKIFTTRSTGPNGARQPISTKIQVATLGRDSADIMLNFGTGLRKEGYLGQAASFARGQQSVYGLRDVTVRTSPTAGNTTAEIDLSQLQEQAINLGNQQLSSSDVDWNTQRGWYMNLTTVTLPDGGQEYEQLIYNPTIENNRYLILNTFVNGSSPLLSCSSVDTTGYTYPLATDSGAGLKGFFDKQFDQPAYRQQLNATGAPLILHADGQILLVYKTSSGQSKVDRVYFKSAKIRRLSWREIF